MNFYSKKEGRCFVNDPPNLFVRKRKDSLKFQLTDIYAHFATKSPRHKEKQSAEINNVFFVKLRAFESSWHKKVDINWKFQFYYTSNYP
jgi:hypothetical protein